MYRFLMVDDEELVRRGFETKIDWPAAGFEFLPPCENGRDAMAAIDALHPDVVMTDIHMPHADGISVAAHVMETSPDILVVILSGYDEFGYAQAAIRNNVFDYVLKPVTSHDLVALLAKIKAKLDADRSSRAEETSLKARAELSGDLLRSRGLADILAGAAGASSSQAAKAILGFDPEPYACAVLVVAREREGSAPEGADGLARRIEEALRPARKSAFFSPAEGRAAALVFEPGSARCARSAMAAAKALSAGGGLRVGVGRAYGQWIDAPRSYAEAEAALAYRLVRGPSRPFLYVQAAEDRDAMIEVKAREERLCLGIRIGASARVPELADSYVEALGKAELSPQRVRHAVLALYSRACDELAGIGVGGPALSAKLGGDCYGVAESLETSESVSAALASLAEAAAGALESSGLHEPEWKVLDFKELVARRFAEKGFSIGKAAERLSISESYLSKLLRRRLGTSFVDYLADYRIGRAKELLASSDMRAYEIAEAVGYPDARYFGSLFKKKTGMTPSEYRKSLGIPAGEGGEA